MGITGGGGGSGSVCGFGAAGAFGDEK